MRWLDNGKKVLSTWIGRVVTTSTGSCLININKKVMSSYGSRECTCRIKVETGLSVIWRYQNLRHRIVVLDPKWTQLHRISFSLVQKYQSRNLGRRDGTIESNKQENRQFGYNLVSQLKSVQVKTGLGRGHHLRSNGL